MLKKICGRIEADFLFKFIFFLVVGAGALLIFSYKKNKKIVLWHFFSGMVVVLAVKYL